MAADYVAFMDAGCTANPGKLAVAAVICSPAGEIMIESAREAGEGTVNVGEYRALGHAICLANLLGAKTPLFMSDSMLVVQQINGFWAQHGDPTSTLVLEHARCASGLMGFDRWTLKHIPREQNKRADWLVSKFLGHDRALKKAPPVAAVTSNGDSRPGWSQIAAQEKTSRAAKAAQKV